MSNSELESVLAERAIHQVLLRYTRAADRVDLAAMRSCYWPGAPDWHGTFQGPVEEFIPWVERRLGDFESTMHYVTNQNIEIQPDGDTARAESYVIAYHRAQAEQGGAVDIFLGLRYVDRFERRDGEWRIAARICSYDWRQEIAGQDPGFSPAHVHSTRDENDVIHWILDEDLQAHAR